MDHVIGRVPKRSGLKQKLDRLIYVAVIAGPVMGVPQVLKIWQEKNASGVSLLSWAAFIVIAILWLVYGIVQKDKPIIITNILWLAIQISIVVGIILYG